MFLNLCLDLLYNTEGGVTNNNEETNIAQILKIMIKKCLWGNKFKNNKMCNKNNKCCIRKHRTIALI